MDSLASARHARFDGAARLLEVRSHPNAEKRRPLSRRSPDPEGFYLACRHCLAEAERVLEHLHPDWLHSVLG
jgi:hypothetical protein